MEELFVISGDSYASVEEELRSAIDVISRSRTTRVDGISICFVDVESNTLHEIDGTAPTSAAYDDQSDGTFSLIINGQGLVSIALIWLSADTPICYP